MAVEAFRDHPNFFIRRLAPYYGRRNTRKALEVADLPLVRSVRDLEILRGKYGVEAEYLPDAVPDYYFTAEKADPDEFRKKFGIKQEKIFLFVGRMHKLKGPHILVKALKYVSEDVAAAFIGPDGGYLRETLDLAGRIGVKDRVYMLGYVDEETKIKALDSAIALILPSLADHAEVYSIVISEAWARERPVIASRVGEIPYRIKQGINGVLVDPSDPRMLAEAMLKLTHDKELAEEMGRNGRKEVFSWREIAAKSTQLYRQVLEKR
jgi:glycosyltransferase involved in cell wall biosynthesis